MKEKASYLHERVYENSNKNTIKKERESYWKSLLGNLVVDKAIKIYPDYERYLCNASYKVKFNYKSKNFFSNGALKRYYKFVNVNKRIYFPQFYSPFFDYGVAKLKRLLGTQMISLSDTIQDDFISLVSLQLQNICIRTLILQMQRYKQKNLLEGSSPSDEYLYFCEKISCDSEFIDSLFQEFPVLKRGIVEQINKTAFYFSEIINNFQNEKEEIRDKFESNNIQEIVRIFPQAADSHNGGKQVVKILFDNGLEVLYKPHSMQNEINYGKMLEWLEKKTGIHNYQYSILSKQTHSWCEIIKESPCGSENELRNYYRRFGVHIFLAYVLGSRDLHYENLIAGGEFPVLVDLEALLKPGWKEERETAEKALKVEIEHSVLSSGLLPLYVWNKNGKGINVSAISGGDREEYPIKVPFIVEEATSNMHIEYKRPYSAVGKNKARLGNTFPDPAKFWKEVQEGFTKSYLAVLQEKDNFWGYVRFFFHEKSRVILVDSQRYSMLSSSSWHPDLLQDGVDREIFLFSLWKGRSGKEKKLVDYEIRCLLEGDIPYFYIKGDSSSLWADGKAVNEKFFIETAMERGRQKILGLSYSDMERQNEYIRISLYMSGEMSDSINEVYSIRTTDLSRLNKGMKIENTKYFLLQKLIKEAVWNDAHTEVTWPAVCFLPQRKRAWHIGAVNQYLYGGLAGILILTYVLAKENHIFEMEPIFGCVRNQMFRYTEQITEGKQSPSSTKTGVYEGESSIAYAYLLLYQWSKESIYMVYAEKHMEIVTGLLQEDRCYDLLSGNAGAAIMYLKLGSITREKKWLKLAEKTVDLLKKAAIKMKRGIGWKTDPGFPPMAGMAHGNSGIMIPVCHLWKLTNREEYKKLAEEILEYEEELYDPIQNNWLDMRNGEESKKIGEGTVAWCHGAAGILLSRIICQAETGFLDENWDERLKRDIKNAYRKLKEYWLRDSWSICHGNIGNIWILEKVAKLIGAEEDIKKIIKSKKNLKQNVRLLPQEEINPGLMNGYGGVLLYIYGKEYFPFLI